MPKCMNYDVFHKTFLWNSNFVRFPFYERLRLRIVENSMGLNDDDDDDVLWIDRKSPRRVNTYSGSLSSNDWISTKTLWRFFDEHFPSFDTRIFVNSFVYHISKSNKVNEWNENLREWYSLLSFMPQFSMEVKRSFTFLIWKSIFHESLLNCISITEQNRENTCQHITVCGVHIVRHCVFFR